MASSKNYKIDKRLEVFYTGGAVRVSGDGAQLACACSDEVKVPSSGMQNIAERRISTHMHGDAMSFGSSSSVTFLRSWWMQTLDRC